LVKVSSLLVVALCSTLFLGLFAFSGVPSSNSENALVRGDLGNVRSAPVGRSTPPLPSSLPLSVPSSLSISDLTETSGERGHFVTSNDVGPNSTSGFNFYSPITIQAGFDVNKSHLLYQGIDNESLFLSFAYLNTLGIKDIIGRRPRDVSVTHIFGNDSQEWTTTADAWGAVRYRDLWAGGIDLRYVAVYGTDLINGFKSDFILTESSADPADIAVEVSGAESLVVSADGQVLTIVTELGNITQEVYMYEMATEEQVPGNFTVDGSVFGFEVGASWTKLVIDPLIYSTFLGDTGDDDAQGVFVDDEGNAYVTGTTTSADFPTTPGAYDTSYGTNTDAFVCKLAPNGSTLLYSTFVGGSGGDYGHDIAVDSLGNAYVFGGQNSADFPTTVGAFDEQDDGADQGNLFVLCLAANGSVLLWSGTASGNDWDRPYALALDPVNFGDVLVAGFTESADFPVTVGAYDVARAGTIDGFIARVSANGSVWGNCTFIGGTGVEILQGIGVNSTGFVYFSGQTDSNDFPTAGGHYDTSHNGEKDLICGIFTWDLTSLLVSGYVGGSDIDEGGVMDLLDDRLVIAGHSKGGYPTTAGAFNQTHAGGKDVVVSVLSMRLDTLNYSTYIGGNVDERVGDTGSSVAIDDNGNVWVTGVVGSDDFPIHSCGVQDSRGGGWDAFLVALPQDLSNLSYSTYLGGTSNDYGRGVAVKAVPGDAWSRDVFVVGLTTGDTFPTTSGAFDESFGGGNDAFVVCLYNPLPQPLVSDVVYDAAVELGVNWTIYAKVTCIDNVSSVKLGFNGTYYDMSNSTLDYYNYTVTIVTMNPGTNVFTIWASGLPGNTTETDESSFSVGNVPQFSDYSATTTAPTAVLWSMSLSVTDDTAGDSGLASVWFRFESHEDGWVAMTGDGDTYTSPSYAFSDEGGQIWQVMAIDNVGNVGYSTQNTLTVGGGASIASTSSTLTVTVAADPWEPTEVSSWVWWVYVLVFTCLVLGFALTAAPRIHNGELFMSLLVAVGAGGMLAAYLSAVPGVLPLEMIGLVWVGLLGWAWASSRGGPVGLVAGGAVLLGYLAVQLWLADLYFSWLLGAYVVGSAACGTTAGAVETGNVYVVAVSVILGIIGVVFGVLSVFA
jgi:hypothetical protein